MRPRRRPLRRRAVWHRGRRPRSHRGGRPAGPRRVWRHPPRATAAPLAAHPAVALPLRDHRSQQPLHRAAACRGDLRAGDGAPAGDRGGPAHAAVPRWRRDPDRCDRAPVRAAYRLSAQASCGDGGGEAPVPPGLRALGRGPASEARPLLPRWLSGSAAPQLRGRSPAPRQRAGDELRLRVPPGHVCGPARHRARGAGDQPRPAHRRTRRTTRCTRRSCAARAS